MTEAYCFKCKRKVVMSRPESSMRLKNGAYCVHGFCRTCKQMKVATFVSSKNK